MARCTAKIYGSAAILVWQLNKQITVCRLTSRVLFVVHESEQVAQLSQRDRAAGWVSNGQKWKAGTERQYLRTGLYSTTATYLASKEIEIGEKTQNKGLSRRLRSFKVIQGHRGRYQSKARM